MNPLVLLQVRRPDEGLPAGFASVRLEARVNLQVLWVAKVKGQLAVQYGPDGGDLAAPSTLPLRCACVVKALVQISQAKGRSAEWSFSCFLR